MIAVRTDRRDRSLTAVELLMVFGSVWAANAPPLPLGA